MKIGIIGNGILGSSLAYQLSNLDSKLNIKIFGDPTRSNSASMAAAAMLNSFAEVDSLTDYSATDLDKFNLSQKAARLWPSFVEKLIHDSGVDSLSDSFKLGTFVINNSAVDSLDDDNFEAILKSLAHHQEQHSLVDVKNIPNYMPQPHARAQRALYIPREGWINPKLVLFALDKYMNESINIEVCDSLIRRVELINGVSFRFFLEDGTTEDFDCCVIANGTAMNDLNLKETIGVSIQKLFYGVGTTVELESEFEHTHCIRTPNRGLACGVYTAPYFDQKKKSNNVIVGASNFIANEKHAFSRVTSVRTLLTAAEQEINKNFYRANLLSVNVGWRPTSQDTYPLIGQTHVRNLFVLNGTKRDGFHFSPLISENIAGQIVDSTTLDMFKNFSPERELITTGTREIGIENAIKHRLSAAYQHGYKSSTPRMDDLIISSWRRDLSDIYDQAKVFDFAIPVEMLDMYKYGHAKI